MPVGRVRKGWEAPVGGGWPLTTLVTGPPVPGWADNVLGLLFLQGCHFGGMCAGL